MISKENGGHGSTINRGIEEASGKYFKVVDGDDWVFTEGLRELVSLLKECRADYVFTNLINNLFYIRHRIQDIFDVHIETVFIHPLKRSTG